MATFLTDIIDTISDNMKVASVPLQGSEEDWNEQLDEAGANNSLILYDLAQAGTMEVTRSKKGYLVYNTTFLFVTVPANAPDSTGDDITQAQNDMLELAYQFFARLRNVDAWRTHPENNATSLLPSFQQIYDRFNQRVAGVSATVDVRIDPSFDITDVC